MGSEINKLSPDVSEDGTLDEEPSLRFRLHPKLTDKNPGNTPNHSQIYIPKISLTDIDNKEDLRCLEFAHEAILFYANHIPTSANHNLY